MNIYKEIERIKSIITKLEADLTKLRQKYDRTQDEALKNIVGSEISDVVDKIDKARNDLETAEAIVPEKRTNGHHKAESVEEEELPPDYDVDKDGNKPSDN